MTAKKKNVIANEEDEIKRLEAEITKARRQIQRLEFTRQTRKADDLKKIITMVVGLSRSDVYALSAMAKNFADKMIGDNEEGY